MKRIAVIAPHSDDETLGAGGYLLKHKHSGDEIFWINVTNAKVEYGYSQEEVNNWNCAIQRIKAYFDFDGLFDLRFEPAGLHKIDQSVLISEIRKALEKIKPQILMVPFYADTHSDHRIVFDAALACSKSFRCPSVEMILCMEIISETDYAISDNGFVPNYYVDISDYIDKKVTAMKIYETEMAEPPFPRSTEAIRGLARYRGASCYSNYAEAFRMIKYVER